MTSDDDWDAAFAADPDTSDADTSNTEQQSGMKPFFPDVETWVRDWLAPVITRPQTNSLAWCAEWWRHAEAISRLEALWRAWEHLRLDGTTGMSTWWRDHFDPHWRELTDVDKSPFADCHHGHKDSLEPLPVEPAPEGWWSPPADDEPAEREEPPRARVPRVQLNARITPELDEAMRQFQHTHNLTQQVLLERACEEYLQLHRGQTA